uniref:Uncharacterized protein n=1 Tax=Triticum urartu TaxID=4572 RepID=A0A8R7K1W3_TRIUA
MVVYLLARWSIKYNGKTHEDEKKMFLLFNIYIFYIYCKVQHNTTSIYCRYKYNNTVQGQYIHVLYTLTGSAIALPLTQKSLLLFIPAEAEEDILFRILVFPPLIC